MHLFCEAVGRQNAIFDMGILGGRHVWRTPHGRKSHKEDQGALQKKMRLVRVRVSVSGGGTAGRDGVQLWTRGLLLVVAICFLWLQLHVSSLASRPSGPTAQPSDTVLAGVNSTALVFSMVPAPLHKYLTLSRNNGSRGNGSAVAELGIDEMLRQIERYNTDQTVLNEELFGPINNDTLIIVIQVHNRLEYLRHLIVSLAQARDIESTLIIFSHDYFDPEMNEVVQSVDFARVLQIFYPLSLQTHNNSFPGQSPSDCPRDITPQQAKVLGCENAASPDLYGHYREAKFTQAKHHWWWKANRVFDQLHVTKNHSGLVLFLEEDHYVAEDFIFVLKSMQTMCATHCPSANVFSLGTYLKTYNYYYSTSSKAELMPWVSSKHNMGMAFNRSVWTGVVKCAQHFCHYDDYNWDWSLQHVSQQCLPERLTAVVMRAPRVFHIGECGVHHRKANCDSTLVIAKVQKVVRAARRHLYPRYLQLSRPPPSTKKQKNHRGNGGWGDSRDHQLCLNFTLGS